MNFQIEQQFTLLKKNANRKGHYETKIYLPEGELRLIQYNRISQTRIEIKAPCVDPTSHWYKSDFVPLVIPKAKTLIVNNQEDLKIQGSPDLILSAKQ